MESDRSYGGTAELTKPFGDHELMVGVEHKVLAYGDTTVDTIDMAYNNARWVTEADLNFEPSSEGICWGYYIQDSWQISDRWRLTAGLRYDTYKNRSINGSTSPELDDDALTPKLTATYHASDVDTITGSAYQALRTPGLPETYWWAEGATNGNPTLKPETNNAAELIYRHNFSDSDYLRIAAYYYNVEDYIVSRFYSTWKGVYNIDRAEFYGASLDGHLTLTDWLSANAALTWQQSKKRGDFYDTAELTDEIDYLPDWKASAGLAFQLPLESVFNVSLRYVGERKAIYAYTSGWPMQQYFKLVEMDAYITADINLKVPVGKHTELSFYAENLFDEEYEEQYGYPMPGLIVGAAVKLSL
ncbi:TonB-dependent receptor, plug (fragment) [Desulfosarcina cetonica]